MSSPGCHGRKKNRAHIQKCKWEERIRGEKGEKRTNIAILKGRNKIVEHIYQTKEGPNPAKQTAHSLATHLLSKLSDGPCSPASLPVCTSLYPWMVALPLYSSPQQMYHGYCIPTSLGFNFYPASFPQLQEMAFQTLQIGKPLICIAWSQWLSDTIEEILSLCHFCIFLKYKSRTMWMTLAGLAINSEWILGPLISAAVFIPRCFMET